MFYIMTSVMVLVLLTWSAAVQSYSMQHRLKQSQRISMQQFKLSMPHLSSSTLLRANNNDIISKEVEAVQEEMTFSPLFDVNEHNAMSTSKVMPDNAAQFLTALILPVFAMFLSAEPAFADASQYGVLAGRTASMMHPITNFALFATSLYSAYLGFQWRRLRDLSEEIKNLNTELPRLNTASAKFPLADTASSITQELNGLVGVEGNDARIAMLRKDLDILKGSSDLEERYKSLTTTRKSLQGANLKDKHHLTGSILLGAGVSVSVLGAFNTYMRAGRLFPGPHLYAGMAITILWAVAASLVPAMQKGNENARIAHIGLNVINILLFAWQVPTGIEIMLSVWSKTHW